MPKAPPFNSISAVAAGKRSAIVRADKLRSAIARVAELELAIAAAQIPAQPRPVLEPDPSLARASVLSQIETLSKRLDAMLAEGHPRAIESIARALGYLREQERVLAGRPLPGVLKPRPAKRSSAPGIDDLPPPTPMF